MKGLQGFRDFIKNQGVFGLAVGFILGGAVSKFVSSLVTDIIYPILNGLLGGVDDLTTQVFYVGGSAVKYGSFLNTGIDFIMGGHTHDGVPEAVPVKNATGTTYVCNAGSNGKFLNVLDSQQSVRKLALRRVQANILKACLTNWVMNLEFWI